MTPNFMELEDALMLIIDDYFSANSIEVEHQVQLLKSITEKFDSFVED